MLIWEISFIRYDVSSKHPSELVREKRGVLGRRVDPNVRNIPATTFPTCCWDDPLRNLPLLQPGKSRRKSVKNPMKEEEIDFASTSGGKFVPVINVNTQSMFTCTIRASVMGSQSMFPLEGVQSDPSEPPNNARLWSSLKREECFSDELGHV